MSRYCFQIVERNRVEFEIDLEEGENVGRYAVFAQHFAARTQLLDLAPVAGVQADLLAKIPEGEALLQSPQMRASGLVPCLTVREVEVLQLIAEGHANKMIADILKISVKTVEKHRQSCMNRLNIHDTASLTRYAIQIGLIDCRQQKVMAAILAAA